MDSIEKCAASTFLERGDGGVEGNYSQPLVSTQPPDFTGFVGILPIVDIMPHSWQYSNQAGLGL